MDPITGEYLEHYGTPRHSGRYPWGSGKEPYQHGKDFLARVDELKKSGMSEAEIARAIGLTTTQLRTQKSLANAERRGLEVDRAKSLAADGLGPTEIGRIMGKSESTVRSLLNSDSEARMREARKTADFLKERVDKVGMVDVGAGVERELGVSKEKMDQALETLRMEGYEVYGGRIPQATNPGKQTTLKVLCPPGTKHKDIYDYENIHSLRDYTSHDDGQTFDKFVYPKSLDSKRVQIRYAEDGGKERDGLVEIRRNVPDISMGNATYAQVRILVDGNKYIKGMAVYSDDLPVGVDIRFNTNKTKSTPKMEVLKNIKDDPDNPFGSLIMPKGQTYYTDKNGKKQLSVVNKTREEGEWENWKNGLPSQFLSKQTKSMIDKQLKLSVSDKKAEFDEICSLTNPTVKRSLLKSFSDDCDSAAVHLKAASLPRQKYQVILPVPSMKDNEIYAPNYKNGEKVALIRYPHGGTFEIPILTVNNRQSAAKKMLGNNPIDAVGINSKVADRLSGADFDGDTVMVIPTGKRVKVTSTPPLKGLEGFDPKMSYGPETYKGKNIKLMSKAQTQTEMGKISNLITDMTIKGANQEELARAVRHSMVVIDAEKHKLDYKRSEKDNNIAALKKQYQGTVDSDGRYHEGASTIISRAKSDSRVLKRKGQPRVNQKGKSWYDPSKPEGSLLYNEVREEYTDKKGKTQVRTQKSTKMMDTDDAFTLVSDADNPVERLYATYANSMKSMANDARKEMVYTPRLEYSKTAATTYKKEADALKSKLNNSLKQAPKERQAQVLAKTIIDAKKESNPDMTKEELRKASQQALTNARSMVGAERIPIKITAREWEAIQAGAVSDNTLTRIMNYVDIDDLRERATPRATKELSTATVNRMKNMSAMGYTNAEIADHLGVSPSSVSKYLKG